ncbi:MAG: hypothetical protein M3Y49_08375 [Actinomycetota bacterium]|nr:hypothetical protein [Actinomycetota bacterium]
MTTTAPTTTTHAALDDEQPLDIEALFPADPDLMISPEGDKRGLEQLRSSARERRNELAHQ